MFFTVWADGPKENQ